MKQAIITLVLIAGLSAAAAAEDAPKEAPIVSEPVAVSAETPIPNGIIEASSEGKAGIAKGIEVKRSSSSWEGAQIGAGAGLLNGLSIDLGYRIPYSPSNFWKNRLGFRVEYSTMSPIAKSVEKMIDDAVEVDDNEIKSSVSGSQ
ncbi:MAG: hypothetical protein LBO78_00640, partial [Rickettsiales bacterium]|nr:hypothetical protein [Rickettsiales bacterium]